MFTARYELALNKTVCASSLTLNPLKSTIFATSNNSTKWQMGFISAFKVLKG